MIKRWFALWLLCILVHAEEETCEDDAAEDGGSYVVRVLKNGESSEEGEVMTLTKAQCSSRASFEAQISLAVCGDVVSCDARDAAGRVVSSCEELVAFATEPGVQPVGLPLVYGVPRSMRFVFACEGVGYARSLPHVGVTLRTLSLTPRLFAVEQYLDEATADNVVRDALAIDDDEHRLMRSSTGPSGYQTSSVRTSENAWLKHSKAAMNLKRRAFTMLGFPAYDEDLADGLQVLRYNASKAYVAHTDYLNHPPGVDPKDMDPAVGGSNRLATLFLYLSDVTEGGQTVFPSIDRPDIDSHPVLAEYLETKSIQGDDVQALRDAVTSEGSWEHNMIRDCYSKLAVKPKKGRAILYYSQHPTGKLDPLSQHGGCPVLNGTKWAANLWVWNKKMPFGSSRFGSTTDSSDSPDPNAVIAEVTYRGSRSDVGIYWEGRSQIGELLRPSGTLSLNTYVGHKFVAKNSNGRVFGEFVIEEGKVDYVVDG